MGEFKETRSFEADIFPRDLQLLRSSEVMKSGLSLGSEFQGYLKGTGMGEIKVQGVFSLSRFEVEDIFDERCPEKHSPRKAKGLGNLLHIHKLVSEACQLLLKSLLNLPMLSLLPDSRESKWLRWFHRLP